jgi:hypothetical protein
MGLDTRTHSSLWKDRAVIEINAAVLYSYQVGDLGQQSYMLKNEIGWKFLLNYYFMIFRFFLENERDYRRSSHSLRIFYEVS